MDPSETDFPTEAPKPEGQALIVDAKELFKGHRQIVIDYEGTRYSLRITRRGRLILTK
ncbi:MAG: hemin uptake protein HemP [Gemmataceae bacterium]|nr:hemin uptake protein HemP [Gemmataceae bacterium]